MKGRLVSPRGPIGVGKTTAAKILVDRHGFVRVAFAERLKNEVFEALMAAKRFGNHDAVARFTTETGITLDPALLAELPDADTTCETSNRWIAQRNDRLRPLLQWWGTEYRRNGNPRYWIDYWRERTDPLRAQGIDVATDDARFDNEIDEIIAMGGCHVFLTAPDAVVSDRVAERAGSPVAGGLKNHPSERNLDPNDPRNRHVIENDGTTEKLAQRLEEIAAAELIA